MACRKKKTGAVQETLPQGREKPVAGLKPVSRQRVETILPSEKEEGSSVETQEQQSLFQLHFTQTWKIKEESNNGSENQEMKD